MFFDKTYWILPQVRMPAVKLYSHIILSLLIVVYIRQYFSLFTTCLFDLHHDIILLFYFFVPIFILFFAFINLVHGILDSVKVFFKFVVFPA
jgi:hypothetical protein